MIVRTNMIIGIAADQNIVLPLTASSSLNVIFVNNVI